MLVGSFVFVFVTKITEYISLQVDTWECMSQECREVAVQLPYKEIRATLDGYLKRHKFCVDCSKMVNKAYNLLVEDIQVGGKSLEGGHLTRNT